MTNRGLANLSVLVVDDNFHMLSLLRTILQGLGIQAVGEATDPADAFERFRNGSYDIVFVDIKMPVLDGIEFIQLVRNAQDSSNPYVPIIVASAYSERAKVLAARDAGATEFVRKPLSADEVYKKLKSVIERPRAFVRSQMYFGPDRRRHNSAAFDGKERREGKTSVEV